MYKLLLLGPLTSRFTVVTPVAIRRQRCATATAPENPLTRDRIRQLCDLRMVSISSGIRTIRDTDENENLTHPHELKDITMAPVRRIFLTEPESNLVVVPDPLQAWDSFQHWVEFTGVDPSHMIVSPTFSVPLMSYPENWPDGRRRWSGVKPGAMWHPLLWLPPRLSARYQVETNEGELVEEDDVTWSVRVALEMIASGLYNPENGSWLDILSLVDIDPETPDGMVRVQSWLQGSEDEVLDAIDLTDFLVATEEFQQNPDWAISLAFERRADLLVINWTKASEDFIDELYEMLDDTPDELDMLKVGSSTIARIAGLYFSAIEVDEDSDYDEGLWWKSVADAIESYDGAPDRLIKGPLNDMLARLQAINKVYAPQAELLAASAV